MKIPFNHGAPTQRVCLLPCHTAVDGPELMLLTQLRRSKVFGKVITIFDFRDRHTHLTLDVVGDWLKDFRPKMFHAFVIDRPDASDDSTESALHLSSFDECTSIPASHLLPEALCPERSRWALDEIAWLESILTIEPLKRFLQSVLLDPNIWPKMLMCRSSARHHHNWPGGNLEHSVDQLRLLYARCARESMMDRATLEIVLIVYFVHDIGKIQTVGGPDGRPRYAFATGDITQALLLLAPHLSALKRQCYKLESAITHSLEWLGQPADVRRRDSRCVVPELVSLADRNSALLFQNRGIDSLSRSMFQKGASFQGAANDPSYRHLSKSSRDGS